MPVRQAAEDGVTDALTSRLAEAAAAVRFEDMEPVARRAASHHLLDALGCGFVGGRQPVVGKVANVMAGFMRPATVAQAIPLFHGGRADPLTAAYLNAIAIHALEADDGFREGSMHPAAVVIPAVLAAAYLRDCDGRALLAAIAAGYEVALRVGGLLHPHSTARGFQNTPVAGIVGAAAGAAHVFGLPAAGIEQAIGIAASSASGIFAYLAGGGNIKKLHPGNAARDGLLAACLTRDAAIQGPAAVLEGRFGLLHSFGGVDARRLEAVQDGLAITRCYIKPYPCCRHFHPAIDAILELRKTYGFSGGDVAALNVSSYAAAVAHAGFGWSSLLEAQLSFPYALAVALEHGEVGIAGFMDGARADQAILNHVAKIAIAEDPAANAAFPGEARAYVVLRMQDGRVLSQRVSEPLGSPANRLPEQALLKKFDDLVAGCMDPAKAARIADQVLSLHKIGSSRAFLDSLVEPVA